MANSHGPGSVSLWRIRTRASVVECWLVTLSDLHYEVRLTQDGQDVVAERFGSGTEAQTYARNLWKQLERLSVEGGTLNATGTGG